jgi:hypothetical protein
MTRLVYLESREKADRRSRKRKKAAETFRLGNLIGDAPHVEITLRQKGRPLDANSQLRWAR